MTCLLIPPCEPGLVLYCRFLNGLIGEATSKWALLEDPMKSYQTLNRVLFVLLLITEN